MKVEKVTLWSVVWSVPNKRPHLTDSQLALEIALDAIRDRRMRSDKTIAQLTLESLAFSAKRLIKTLVSAAGEENGKFPSMFFPELLLDECRSLARFCPTIFHMRFSVIVSYVCLLGYRPREIWPLLDGGEHIFDLHPIMQAIFQESINMLDIALTRSPEAVTEKILGMTTVRLCVCWPEGLQKLLHTNAVGVLDESALEVAVNADCIESADLLFKAGCPVNYGDKTESIFQRASELCMDVIASNLARRRSDLLSLAQQQQVVCQDLLLTSDIPDDQASYLCSCLDKSGISIPLALRVPSSYTTIYHFRGTSIYHYPILFKNGFTHLSAPNVFGLLPTMTQHLFHEPRRIEIGYGNVVEGMDWVESQRIMEQTPKGPFNLGLNIGATSWHYLSRYCSDFHPPLRCFYPGNAKGVLGVPLLDNCRCWCTPPDKGCTPLTTGLKAYVKDFNKLESNVLCSFFHTVILDTEEGDSYITGWCNEVIRFLTFEALEMTHTCCQFTVIDRPDISPDKFNLLMNCDPRKWQKIRSHKREQENAALLERLMEEFIAYMMHMRLSTRSLEIFVNGYWRQRMSEIYAVDSNEIKNIQNCLVGIKTQRCASKQG
ncbi:uncharacterized protein FMAN_12890 [Fusarium mangiferae]|uniref:Uncharacterized protein n=1 Tax=Fusarium mangiferae TaxID=192010 RepID=A0A1L7UAR8_FUSMA|nr:uncharacterized protein FMAN_12890 [Fusarium mangiferae]CVL04827.1 uncharacterized protein FMAN_12890 [Fusarium mangiferae]